MNSYLVQVIESTYIQVKAETIEEAKYVARKRVLANCVTPDSIDTVLLAYEPAV